MTRRRLAPGRGLRPRADRAWTAVGGAFLLSMVGYGAIYSYAAFAEAIAAEFGASRAEVSLVYGLSAGGCLMVGAITGPLADRLGARLPAAVGMLLVALGFLVAASADTLIEVWLGYGLLVGLGAGSAYVPSLAAVQRGFRAHRGLASGLAVSGIGVGTALVPPAAAWLATLGDWRLAFVVAPAVLLPIGLLGAMLLGGGRPPRAGPASRAVAAPAPARAGFLAPPGLGLAYAGVLLASLPSALPHALLVASAGDLGLPSEAALALLGLIGLGTIVGRFLLAALADVLGRQPVFLACCLGMALSLLGWAAATEERGLQGFALGFGALQGGFVALLPAFLADRYGPRGLGTLLGVLYTARGLTLLAGPPLVALGVAAAGGLAWPLALAALAGALGTGLLARAARAAAERAPVRGAVPAAPGSSGSASA